MSRSGNAKSMIFLTAALLCTASTPSFALSVIHPAYAEQAVGDDVSNTPVSAFSNGNTAKGNGDLLLSAEEIRHIRWCAARYPSYHASDNTYTSVSGTREECRSN